MARRSGSRATALVFLLVALMAAGIFALLFMRLVQGYERELAEAQEEEDLRPAVVAGRELVQGDTLREEDLVIVNLPPTFVHESTFQFKEDVIGRVPRERILPGEFIREDRLADAESGVGLNAIIPRGMRAVSINISDGSAVSGFLNPGNYVDVLVTILGDDRTEKTVTLLQATRVLAVDNRLGSSANTRGEAGYKPSVTLAVTPEQAERLAHSQIEGDVVLTLRNDIDVTQVETHGADASRLLGGAENQVALSTIAPTPRPAPPPAVERESPQELLIIRGSKSETRDPRPGEGRRRR